MKGKKTMCNYCYYKENGDCGDNWGLLGEGVATVPMAYTIKDETRKKELSINDELPILLQLCIGKAPKTKEKILSVSVEVKGNEIDEDGYVPNEILFPIYFCPMCGSKLNK